VVVWLEAETREFRQWAERIESIAALIHPNWAPFGLLEPGSWRTFPLARNYWPTNGFIRFKLNREVFHVTLNLVILSVIRMDTNHTEFCCVFIVFVVVTPSETTMSNRRRRSTADRRRSDSSASYLFTRMFEWSEHLVTVRSFVDKKLSAVPTLVRITTGYTDQSGRFDFQPGSVGSLIIIEIFHSVYVSLYQHI